MTERRILVVGAGFAGLHAAMGLKEAVTAGHHVTVANAESFFQYQPFLPEVASGTIDPRAAVVPLRGVLRHCRLLVGEVTRIDHYARRALVRIATGEERTVAYDVLVLTPGSRSRVLPIPGLAEHGIGFKTVQEAIYLRNHVLSQLDVAASAEDPDRRRAALTFVFVGGGYAGVEALGELEDLARDAIANDPGLRSSDMRWVLVDAADRILPELSEDLGSYAADRLRDRGVEVLLSTRLESAEDGVVRLSDGQAFPAETLVWTAGVKPSPLARNSGLPVDEQGRVPVDAFLRIEGLDDAWAAGDAAAVPDASSGSVAPPTAQHGLREGRRLAANVTAVFEGGEVRPFAYTSIGGVCSLGRYKGVAIVKGVRLRGFAAWVVHRSYHLLAMPTWTRRVKIAMDWTVALLFPRDLAQLGSLRSPREPFERAAGD
ncbi:MAG TPA: NAD(P)/FAD-dependent oxidoreductase [Actinomycetota bacterium]|nr:NAD(P)/FAD-dependent oxidoreductase [Actinomycetota bacterium]